MDRKRFPVENYPKIQEYIGDKVDQDFMQYPYRLMEDDDMANIILGWIKYYEEHINRTVENTFALFNVASGSLGGHQVMGELWNYNGRKPNPHTVEDIREHYRKNFIAAICHLFQAWGTFKGKNSDKRIYKFHHEYSGGATGLGIYVQWSLQFLESDYKHVAANCVTNFSFGIRAECSEHSEYDIND